MLSFRHRLLTSLKAFMLRKVDGGNIWSTSIGEYEKNTIMEHFTFANRYFIENYI